MRLGRSGLALQQTLMRVVRAGIQHLPWAAQHTPLMVAQVAKLAVRQPTLMLAAAPQIVRLTIRAMLASTMGKLRTINTPMEVEVDGASTRSEWADRAQ